MNTFWLKIAGLVLIVVVVVVLIGTFTSSDSEKSPPPAESKVQLKAKQRTYYDQVEDDKEKFSAEPQPVEEKDPNQRPKRPEKLEVPVKPLDARKRDREQKLSEENQTPAKPTVLYFKPLEEIEQIEAERLLNVAVPGRSIGRLPVASFSLMVQTCRQIISKWPDSWYAYRAKQMLADMPERFRPRYKVTAQEMDVSKFAEQRPGTEPFTVEDSPK